MKKMLKRYLAIFVCITILFSLNIGIVNATAASTFPKNVIILIGDGMGFNHVNAARAQKGSALYMDGLQYSGSASTANYAGQVTDSAAAGTALACGVKTYNSRIGKDINGNNVQNLSEYFKGYGKKAGIVSTSYITDATPAAFSAHNLSRSNYNAIAIDQINNNMDVILGGGRWYFDQNPYNYSNGTPSTLLNVAVNERGYTYVSDKNALMATGATKVLGLFVAQNYMTLDINRNPAIEPSLAEMTQKSIDILSTDPDGFFLMVEGGQIDTESHSNRLSNTIGETLAFDSAVDVALDFLAQNPDTLVIVTADHETGGLTYNSGTGQYTYTSTNHTGVNVPVYASGAGAQYFSGTLVNTDIPNRIKQIAGSSGEGVSFYNYKKSGTTIKGLSEQMTKDAFLGGLLLSDNASVKLIDKDGLDMAAPDYDGNYIYIGTGADIEIYIDDVLAGTYNAFLRGDVNGDGYIDSGDIYTIKRYMAGLESITGEYLTAANADNDAGAAIDTGDMLLIRRNMLGIETINQQA